MVYILILGTYFTSLVLGNITVPHLLFINGNVPIGVLLNVFFFGAGWGLVGIGFGIGLNTLGFAPGSAIIFGLNNAVGAILPIILYTPEELNTPADIGISSGVGIISGEWKGTGRKPLITMIFGLMLLVTGISVISWAGSL